MKKYLNECGYEFILFVWILLNDGLCENEYSCSFGMVGLAYVEAHKSPHSKAQYFVIINAMWILYPCKRKMVENTESRGSNGNRKERYLLSVDVMCLLFVPSLETWGIMIFCFLFTMSGTWTCHLSPFVFCFPLFLWKRMLLICL